MDKDKTPPSLRERISAGVRGVLDPKGQAEIRAEDKAEARSAAELLTTATKDPERVVVEAKAQVAIVEDASTQLQAMVDDKVNMPDLSRVKALASTAEAAGKALDAQEAALKSAQEAFTQSNPDLSKAEAEPNGAKKDEEKAIEVVVEKGNEAMKAIAPAREVLYQMWLQDCQAVADVIAGKKKPEDIKPPVVHTLMGALDAYSKNKEKFKLDDTQKTTLDAAVLNVSLAIDKDAAVKNRFTFDEAAYNEARAKKAVIDRDAAPVALRPEQAAKVAQKGKLDKAIAYVDAEKNKLTVAQGEVEQKREELVGRVEKDATAAFDKVQDKIDQLSIDAQNTAPGEVLSADDKRTRHVDVSKSWEEAMRKFQDVDPVRAKLVTENLAKLAELLFPDQEEKSGKKPAYSRLNFRRMYATLAKSKVGKFVGGAINRARSSLDTIVQKLNGEDVAEVVAEVKTEKDAREWVDRITNKVRLTPSYKQAPYWTVPREMQDTYEELLKAEGESIYSEADQEKLFVLTEECGRANGKLEAYNTHHKELEELLEKAEKYIEKAKEIALKINIQKIETRITELTDMPNVTDEDKRARLTDYSEITESWSELIRTLDYMSQDQIDAVNAKIAALSKALFPAPAAGKDDGKNNKRHSIFEWPGLIAGWFKRKGEPAKGDKPAGQAAAEKDPQNKEEVRQRLEDLRTAEQVFIDRVNNAFSTLSVDKVDDFNAQLLTAGLYFNTDRDRLSQLLAFCEDAQDVVATYIENRAELKALLAKAQAYADKAEEIARKLNTERRDGGVSTPEISDGDIQRWFARVNLDLIAAKGQYDNALREINTDHPELYSSFYDQLEELDKMPGYGVGEGDLWTEARRLLNVYKTSDGTPADNLKKYEEVHEWLNALIIRIKEYVDAVEVIKNRLIQEHSSKKAEGVDPAETERARRAVRELIGKKQDYLTRIAQAFNGFDDKKKEEFKGKINAAMQFPDEARFSVLVSKCFRDLGVVTTYNTHRAELEGIVADLKAYAEKSEEIARELNGAAANTAGKSGEAGGAGVAREPANASEAMAWLNGIRERSNGFLGAIKRAENSVIDKSAVPTFTQMLREYEDSHGGPITYGDLEARLSGFEKSNNPLQYYLNHHQEIEAKVDAYAKYIEQAKAIAARLNSPESPAGGSAGGSAAVLRSEVSVDKPEARAETSELVGWINSTSRKLVNFTDRFSKILAQINTDERESFQKTQAYESYRRPYDSAVKVYDRLRSGYVQGDKLYPTAQEFTVAKEEVERLLNECEKNLATAEANIAKIKTELSEGDKPADKGEAKSFIDSVKPRIADLNAKVNELETKLSKEDKTAFNRSPEAETYYTALRLFNEINGWIKGTSNTTVITVTQLRAAIKRIPELIAQCEGPINTYSDNLKKN